MSTKEAVRPNTVIASMVAGDIQIHAGNGDLLWAGQYVEFDDDERITGYIYKGNPNVKMDNPLTDFIINKFKVRNAIVYMPVPEISKTTLGQIWIKEVLGLEGPIKVTQPAEHYRR